MPLVTFVPSRMLWVLATAVPPAPTTSPSSWTLSPAEAANVLTSVTVRPVKFGTVTWASLPSSVYSSTVPPAGIDCPASGTCRRTLSPLPMTVDLRLRLRILVWAAATVCPTVPGVVRLRLDSSSVV